MDEQNLTDVRYALAQLRGFDPWKDARTTPGADRVQRAIDALERIEERLAPKPTEWTPEDVLRNEG